MTAVICLATCNGRPWISQQVESIKAQLETDWVLLVSDDGSQDGTREMLADLAARDPRIELLPPRNGPPGAAANFEYLLAAAHRDSRSFDVVALSDQDDIWLPHKLREQMDVLANVPGVCSDPLLVDANGDSLGIRLLEQLRTPQQPGLENLLAQNWVVGCTAAFRSEVLELALPFPEGLLNHDWWLALCTLAQGALELVPSVQVHYRQHDDNAIGAMAPRRQLLRLPRLVHRQHRVLSSQVEAIDELRSRLVTAGIAVPEILGAYRDALAAPWHRRLRTMAQGPFAANLPALRALRTLAAFRPLA